MQNAKTCNCPEGPKETCHKTERRKEEEEQRGGQEEERRGGIHLLHGDGE